MLQYVEPEAEVLIGPNNPGTFIYKDQEYHFLLTLKKAHDVDLVS